LASWIVHLRIAEILLSRIPNRDAAQFAIGNIAPDSGVPDEKWENFTPPPHITHFTVGDQPNNYLHTDATFYRSYVSGIDPISEPCLYALHLGYYFHLIIDNLWRQEIGLPTMQRWAAEFAADKDFIWEVKRDWYGLDFIYLRDHPDCLFWQVFIKAGPPQHRLDFLPAGAVERNVAYIQQYYQTIDDEVLHRYGRPYIYLSRAEMDAFVERSAERCLTAWQRLTSMKNIPADLQSSLTL
jgi:hypothetical protein